MPSWLRIVGGPNGLSVWTWLVSFTWTVSITGLLVPVGEGDFRLEWLLAVMASQTILGVGIFLAIRFALPAPVDKPRPTLILFIFVALGITRAVTMHLGSALTGYDDGFTLTDRLVFGVGYSLVFGILIALVVDGARQHSLVMANLRGAERALAEELRKEQSELDHLAQNLVVDLQDRLLTALSDSHLTPAEIRSWASDVVRPLSHELIDAAQSPDTGLEGDQIPVIKTPIRERMAQIASAMRLPSALALIGIAESLAFLLVFQFESPAIAATHTLIGSAVIAASLWLMNLLYRPCAKPIVNFLAVVAAVTFVGVVNVFGTQLVVVLIFPGAKTYPLYVMSVILIGLALSVYQAVRLQQDRAEDVLAETVQHLIARRQEIATAVTQAHTQAARFLHDSIQGILYAAALRGSQASEVQYEIQTAFASYRHARTDPPSANPRKSLDDLIRMWNTAIPVDVDMNLSSAEEIFADSSAADCLYRVISEGLTNAVKHGKEGGVKILVTTNSGDAAITITSPGSTSRSSGSGIGSKTMDEVTKSWSLLVAPEATVLKATIPLGA